MYQGFHISNEMWEYEFQKSRKKKELKIKTMNKRLHKGVIGNDMGGKGKSEQRWKRDKVDTQVQQLRIIHHVPEKVD